MGKWNVNVRVRSKFQMITVQTRKLQCRYRFSSKAQHVYGEDTTCFHISHTDFACMHRFPKRAIFSMESELMTEFESTALPQKCCSFFIEIRLNESVIFRSLYCSIQTNVKSLSFRAFYRKQNKIIDLMNFLVHEIFHAFRIPNSNLR